MGELVTAAVVRSGLLLDTDLVTAVDAAVAALTKAAAAKGGSPSSVSLDHHVQSSGDRWTITVVGTAVAS
jgi:hypothetical protein